MDAPAPDSLDVALLGTCACDDKMHGSPARVRVLGDHRRGLGKLNHAFFGNEAPREGDHESICGDAQLSTEVPRTRLRRVRIGIDRVGKLARRLDPEMSEPCACLPRHSVRDERVAQISLRERMLDCLHHWIDKGATHREVRRPVLDEQRHHACARREIECALGQRVEARVRDHVIEVLVFKMRPQPLRFLVTLHKGKPGPQKRLAREADDVHAVLALARGEVVGIASCNRYLGSHLV